MIEYFRQNFDLIFIPLFLLCLPGMLFILSGVRTIRAEKAVVASRGSRFRWNEPLILKGEEAVKTGKQRIIFGVIWFLIGFIAIIGTLL